MKTYMSKILVVIALSMFSTWLNAAELQPPVETKETLPNGIEVTYKFAPRVNATDKFIRTSTLRKGNMTLSYVQTASDLKEIDGHARQIYLTNKTKKVHLPDAVCGGLKASDIVWTGDYLYVPGMSFCGTAHNQYNDMVMYRATDTKADYLGMINRYLNKPEQLGGDTVLASYAAFDFSPYGGSHANGISIIVVLNKTRSYLAANMQKTYEANQPFVASSRENLQSYLSAATSYQGSGKEVDCGKAPWATPWDKDNYCGIKLGTLHHATEIGAVLMYTSRYEELDALLSQLRQSPVITETDIGDWKEHLQTINPESYSFLFWRTGPENWWPKIED